MITPAKWSQLRMQMQKLGIKEADIQEKFIIGSGRGGQKLQKTASCVYLNHLPTSIEIKCQESRSREDNRFYARRRLLEKIDEQLNQEKSEKQKAIEKIRRQKRKRSRRTQQKILEEKVHRGLVKKLRKSPNEEMEE